MVWERNVPQWRLTFPAFLVELFPFAQRAKGITIFQFFGRGAGFFTTFVNPIGLDSINWRWLITYCCWLAFEIVFIVSSCSIPMPSKLICYQYFMFPETYGRTLEELAFLFEDKALADEATHKVEKQLHHELDDFGYDKRVTTRITAQKGKYADPRFSRDDRFSRWP